MAVAMDAAVASIGNDHDVKLKYAVELRALNIQHMKNTLMVQLSAFPGSPNHQIPGVCVQVFRFSSQVWAIMFGNSGSVFRFVFGYSHSVFIFRYSDSGIQAWVYRQVCTPKPVYPNLNA